MYYQSSMKKFLIKSLLQLSFVLLVAVVSTYYIYNKYTGNREIDISSESLDITYHDKDEDKISITKATPVTESVGLSSNSYVFSIKNNLTEKVNYKVKIIDDIEKIISDQCDEKQIPKEDIKISVKEGNKSNEIFHLSELEEKVLLDTSVDALDTVVITIRVWVDKDSVTPNDSHYHGLIQIIEEDTSIAMNR